MKYFIKYFIKCQLIGMVMRCEAIGLGVKTYLKIPMNRMCQQ